MAPTRQRRGLVSTGSRRLTGPDRLAIATPLRDIARLLDAAGDARFRARAYERGARMIETFGGDLEALIVEDRLQELPGIGPGLAAATRGSR